MTPKTTVPGAPRYSCRSTSPRGIPCAGVIGHESISHGSPLEKRRWYAGINTVPYWEGEARPAPDPSWPRKTKSRNTHRPRA